MFPNADQFLHALHDGVLQQHIATAPEALTDEERQEVSLGIYENFVADCYADLMHCNTSRTADHREMWPILGLEHAQVRVDQKIALCADNCARTGDPFATHLLDHMPWYPNEFSKDPLPLLTRGIARGMGRRLRVKTEPLSHASVRNAFKRLLLGAHYWDERLQRSEAVPASEVAAKDPSWPVAYAAYNEAVRARALAALAEPLKVKDPVLQAQLGAQRAVQAEVIRNTPGFLVFANAPWRVGPDEVETLRDEHFTMFKTVPNRHATPREGNCNSGVFFLLRLAALEQQRLAGSASPPMLDGGQGFRTYGAATAINIPHPNTLDDLRDASSST